MGFLVFAVIGFFGGLIVCVGWIGLDMMFGMGFSHEAAQGLVLFTTAIGAATGAVLTVICS